MPDVVLKVVTVSADPAIEQVEVHVEGTELLGPLVAEATLAAETATAAAEAAEASAVLVSGSSSRPDRLFEFLDKFRRIVAYIDTGNTFVISKLKATTAILIGSLGRLIRESPDPGVFAAVADHERRRYFRIGSGGSRVKSLRVDALAVEEINGVSAGAYQTLFRTGSVHMDDTTRELALVDGQSLANGGGASDGVGGGPIALTLAQPYGNLMPAGGERPFASALPDPWSPLVPHVASVDVAGRAGETILGGYQAMTMQLYNRFGLSPDQHSLRLVSAAIGAGATQLANHRDGQILFDHITTAAEELRDASPGQVVRMPVLMWLLGESDAGDGAITTAGYAPALVDFAGEVDAAVRARLASQVDPVTLLSYQLDIPKIGLAQLQASRSSPLVRIAAPMYWVHWAGMYLGQFDQTHRSALAYAQLGGCFAVARFCIKALRRPWRPLQMALDAQGRLDCVVDDGDILFRMEVPHGGSLAFEAPFQVNDAGTQFPLDVRQQGLRLFEGDAVTEKPLADVQIVDREWIRFVGANAEAGDHIFIGFGDPAADDPATGATCLRDRQGDVLKLDDYGGLPVHNYAVLERHQLTAEELA
jgi:hypothetical protein